MTNTKATEQQFTSRLKPFIDPIANADSLCADYYQHWKSNADIHSFPLSTKTEKIETITPDSTEVYISNIWQIGEEGKYYFLSKTFWVRKNNKWYRTGEEAVRLEKRKL